MSVFGNLVSTAGDIMSAIPGMPTAVSAGVEDLGGTINAQAQLQQQQQLQQQTWAREDNAVQRRAADMKAAGINPLLAAGSAASSSAPVSIGTAQGGVPMSGADSATSMLSQRQNIAQTEAQTKLTLNQNEKAVNDADAADSNAKKANLDYLNNAEIRDAGIPLASAYNDLKGKILDNATSNYNLAVKNSIDPKTRATLGVVDDALGSVMQGVNVYRGVRNSPKNEPSSVSGAPDGDLSTLFTPKGIRKLRGN